MPSYTYTDIIARARSILGESTPTFWGVAEMNEYVVDAVQELCDDVTPDAVFAGLRTTSTFASTGQADHYIGSALRDIFKLTAHESDGKYGKPWQKYDDPKDLDLIAFNEGNLTQDQTAIRGYYLIPTGFHLYPIVTTGRSIAFTYTVAPSESSTLTIPTANPNLARPVINLVVSKAASKKSRDLDMAVRYRSLYEQDIARINSRYAGRYGIDVAQVSYVRDET